MPKVSVIVPIWNVEKYLPKCLDSLINQTLKDIEIICINDGSPDNCLSILKEYQSRDNRIIVIDQKNQGVSVARNKGLEIAKGEYIGFVDPDDWLDLDFYEVLYNKAIETNADIVKGNSYIKEDNFFFKSQKNQIIKESNNKFRFNNEFWSAIYKADNIYKYNISFNEELRNSQDCLFLLEILYFSDKFEILLNNITYYNYNRRYNSLDSRILNSKKIKNIIKMNEQRLEFINSKQIDKMSYLIVFDIIEKNLIEYNFKKCSDKNSRIKILKTCIYIFNKCKYKNQFLQQYKKDYHKYLVNKDVKGFYKYLKSSPEYQTKYNLKLFGFISIFKIKEYSNKKNYIKKKFYIFSIPFLKIIKNRIN